MFLPVELERGTKTLQFDVCCEAIDRLWLHSQNRLCKFAIISESKQKNYSTENWEVVA